MIVDIHAHFVPDSFLDYVSASRKMFPSVNILGERNALRMAFCGNDPTRPISPKLSDVGARKDWLKRESIDCQVVGGWNDIFGYELPAAEGADWCRLMNEHMRDLSARTGVLAPLACVPLQSGKLAAEILEDALAKGFHGAMIGTQPNGVGGNLDDPDLNPFWEAASAHKATIFLHPMYTCGDDRVLQYDLVNAAGRVADTTIAVSRMLFSGHLTRYSGLNLVIAHGGGALPYALGRLNHNFEIHPEYANPVAEFSRLYFDSVVFQPRALRYLCDVAGADKVMLGSDHPFPIGDPHPMRVVNETALTVEERAAIAGKTAAKLFHVSCDCGA